ncbi:Signal transduction histidine kinase CheA [hydrothermal vent metagenome]|uniref:histidine kinase n=1 Tax=hydrothermal vent metagenome TaxID=652676 RepID=A0A3B1B9S1_9ZZZZ
MMDKSSNNLGDFSLWDLFHMEVEAQAVIFKHALQKLTLIESEQQAADLEDMIVAAHAIKSAAYMADAEVAVRLAQRMENCLTAVQPEEIELDATHIDMLSCCVDRLVSIATENGPVLATDEDESLLVKLSITFSAGGQEEVAPGRFDIDVADKPDNTTIKPQVLEECSMLELFSVEVEVQAGILTSGLLKLEQEPGQTMHLEELMRAAHSIKGAARMVDVEAAVRVAHVMEDCFVAAQQGELSLDGEHIDVLLKGVDTLSLIASGGEVAALADEVNLLVNQLSAIPAGEAQGKTASTGSISEPISTIAATENAPSPEIKPVPLAGQQTRSASISAKAKTSLRVGTTGQAQDTAIRVSAENLNRLMGLAGEVQLVAQGLKPFNDSLLHLKQHQAELIATLDSLGNVLKGDESVSGLLTEVQHKAATCREFLAKQISELDDYECRSQGLAKRLNSEVISSRMRPFMDGVQGFQRMLRDLARSLGKNVNLVICGKNTPVDRDILEKIEAPLNHLLRNAIDHGIEDPAQRRQAGKPEQATLCLEAKHSSGMLSISVKDDGQGIDLPSLRKKIVSKKMVSKKMAADMMESELMEFLFLPGFSTRDSVTEISGRGVGLDVVHSVVQEMRGVVRATSEPGKGMRFHMQLPLTLSVIRALLVEIAGEAYAFPLARIEHTLKLPRESIDLLEGRQYFTYGNQHVGLVSAQQILELGAAVSGEEDEVAVVMLGERQNCYGVVVDRFLGERNLVVQSLDPRLGKIRDISTGAILDDGSLCLILDVDDLLRSTDIIISGGRLDKISRSIQDSDASKPGKRILVVDDSITVREVERGMLEAKGYRVEVAVDGMDGWNAVRTNQYDLVISDIDMPRMNGFEFVERIKKDSGLKSMPVMIVSYKDREEDRIRGLNAGADYYLTKGSFHDEALLDAVRDLIGEV